MVKISERNAITGSMSLSHHVPLSREKKNKKEEIISFLLCPYRRDSPFPLEPSPPSKSTISPAANRLLLGLSSFHITGNLHLLRVFFFFPSSFFFFVPPSPTGDMVPCLDLRRLDAIKQARPPVFDWERCYLCLTSRDNWRFTPTPPLHYTFCPTSEFHLRSPLDSAQADLPMLWWMDFAWSCPKNSR